MRIGMKDYELKQIINEKLDNIVEFEIKYTNGLKVDELVRVPNKPYVVNFVDGILEMATYYTDDTIEKCIEYVIRDIAEGVGFRPTIVESSLKKTLGTTNLEKWLIKNKVLRYDFNKRLGLSEEYKETGIATVKSYKIFIWLNGIRYELEEGK